MPTPLHLLPRKSGSREADCWSCLTRNVEGIHIPRRGKYHLPASTIRWSLDRVKALSLKANCRSLAHLLSIHYQNGPRIFYSLILEQYDFNPSFHSADSVSIIGGLENLLQVFDSRQDRWSVVHSGLPLLCMLYNTPNGYRLP